MSDKPWVRRPFISALTLLVIVMIVVIGIVSTHTRDHQQQRDLDRILCQQDASC